MSNFSTFLNNTTEINVNASVRNVVNCTDNVTMEAPDFPKGPDQLVDILNALEYVNFVMLPTFLIVGLTGNTLTVIVMNTPRFRHLTTSILLISLAISDALLLVTQPFNKMFVIKLFGKDFRALSDFGCKAFFVFFRTGKMTSSWFVVFLCFERFIAVWFPLKAKLICRKRNALIAIIAVYVIIGGFNISWAYCSILGNGICYPDAFDKSNPAEVSLYRAMLTAGSSLYSLVPMCFMVVLTPLIVWKLASHRQKRKQITTTRLKSDAEATKITAMLLGIVIAYIVLIIPVTTLHNIAFYLGVKAFGNNSNGFLIFRDVAQILEQLNYSINFFLYILTSEQFRTGLKQLLCVKCMNKFTSKSTPKRKTPKNAIENINNQSNESANVVPDPEKGNTEED